MKLLAVKPLNLNVFVKYDFYFYFFTILLVWTIQVCVKRMLKIKDTSNYEPTVADHQSNQFNNHLLSTWSPLFYNGKNYLQIQTSKAVFPGLTSAENQKQYCSTRTEWPEKKIIQGL